MMCTFLVISWPQEGGSHVAEQRTRDGSRSWVGACCCCCCMVVYALRRCFGRGFGWRRWRVEGTRFCWLHAPTALCNGWRFGSAGRGGRRLSGSPFDEDAVPQKSAATIIGKLKERGSASGKAVCRKPRVRESGREWSGARIAGATRRCRSLDQLAPKLWR